MRYSVVCYVLAIRDRHNGALHLNNHYLNNILFELYIIYMINIEHI